MSDSDSELSDYESKPMAKLFNKKKPSFQFAESSSDEEEDEDMIVNKIAPYKRFLGVEKSDSDDDSTEICLGKERDSKRAKCDLGSDTKKQASFGITLDIDDSDDDFEIKESDAMRKAREAREALLTNKANLSIDLNDDVDDEIESIELPSSKPLPPPTGPLIQLELRANVKAAKNHSASAMHLKCTKLSMRLGTTVKEAKELYRQKLGQNLPENATVKFMFDGYEMEDSKTLQQYELECDDLIDATITIEATKSASGKKKTASVCSNGDKFVTIKTTIKGGDKEKVHTYQLKLHDSFSKLLISHRDQHGYSIYKRISLEYNGKEVNPEQTPYHLHKRKNTFEIEIVDEALRVQQVQHLKPSSNDAEGVFHENHGGILIKLRINGDNSDMHNLYIRRTEKFHILMNSFCKKYGLEEKDCKFTFDGCTLNTQGTVEDEDLEGEEVFDVIIDKSRWEQIKKLQKNADVLEDRAYEGGKHIPNTFSGKLVNDPPIKFLDGTNKDSEIRKLQIKGDLGVEIAKEGRYIHIKNIADKSHESFFRVGDRITYINSVKMEDIPCDQISKILKTDTRATNIIELQYFDLSLLQGVTNSSQIRKILVRGKLGVTIVNVGKYIRISRINESRKEFFRVGDKLVSVNGKQVIDLGPNEFKNLLRDSEEGNVLEVQFVGVQDLPKPEQRIPLQSDNTNANAEKMTPLKEIYEIQVLRNNNPQKKRKFRIYANRTLSILRQGYLKKYSQKGCLTVKFYYNGVELDDGSTIQSLRYNENDFIIAMENGASL
ncbi:hypothetical protein CTEN210_01912 [Chaetoceros tenuissimus]|uniref:Ubiquitin-like domain-containing protein n=1 Tax=Chaetoceros tenuissimus TaxID=426638 RepID=A0AAD3H0B8_9STRA|nr:hypothetical protein CTEN210_01912 [Chaetoceros tenuissimus]